MKKKIKIVKLLNCLIVILLIIFFIKHNVFASVKINEFSSDDEEWIELYNDSSETVDINNWIVQDTTSSSKEAELFRFTEPLFMPPNGFCVRNFSNRLNNNGDRLRLIYNNDIKDCVMYGDGNGAFCGEVTDLPAPLGELTGARKPDGTGNWSISSSTKEYSNIITTLPEEKNLCYTPTPSPTPLITPTPIITVTPTTKPTPIPTETSEASPTPAPVSFNNIFLNEVMVNPDAGGHEWVELYNNNDYSANLVNWYIDDAEDSGSSPKKFSLNINAKSYATVDLTSSMFNNSGDVIRLLDFNKTLKDGLTYDSSLKGKTFGRISLTDNTFCFNEPTKGYANSTCLNTDDDEDSNISPTPKPTLVKVVKTAKEKPSSTPKPIVNHTNQLTAVNNIGKNNLIENQVVAMNNFSQNDFGQEEILGSSIGNNNSNINKPLLNSLLFASCSLSFLIALSIIIKSLSFRIPAQLGEKSSEA